MGALLFALATLYALWALFLSATALDRARRAGTLSAPAKVLGLPLIVGTAVIDVAVNWVLGTLVLLDRPREWTLSQRLARLSTTGGWRAAVAKWICSNLLDAFDPTGDHC